MQQGSQPDQQIQRQVWYCLKCETLNVWSFTFRSCEINPSYYDPISEVNLSGDSLNGQFNPLQTSSPVSNPKTPSPNQKQQNFHHAKQNPKTSDSSYTSSSNQKRKSNLRILTINLRSIIDKRSEFHSLLEYTKPDVICATESWLKGVHPGKTPSVDAVWDSEVSLPPPPPPPPPTTGPTAIIKGLLEEVYLSSYMKI